MWMQMIEQHHSDSQSIIRVMVLSNVRLYREGLAHLLKAHDRVSVVGAGAIDRTAMDAIRRDPPDIILLDATVVCESSIVQDLSPLAPESKFVAYGVTDEASQALRCAEAGVSAFVPGDASGEELVRILFGLRAGEFNCSPRVAALLMRRIRVLSAGQAPTRPQDRLTTRELGIVTCIADGLSNKEIAARLGIELSTVKNHVHHILEKLNVSRRTQAAARLRRTGLFTGSGS